MVLSDAGVRDARHTAASLLLLLKVPARVVMGILGHSSYQLTMNTYSHVEPELNSEAARLMAGALWTTTRMRPAFADGRQGADAGWGRCTAGRCDRGR